MVRGVKVTYPADTGRQALASRRYSEKDYRKIGVTLQIADLNYFYVKEKLIVQ